jgi:hypothetical protein
MLIAIHYKNYNNVACPGHSVNVILLQDSVHRSNVVSISKFQRLNAQVVWHFVPYDQINHMKDVGFANNMLLDRSMVYVW